jgi:hypothetical protein
MSDIFVDNIKHQSSQGSGTITLGASGETITTASGAKFSEITGQNYPAFEARLTADQTISNATYTTVNAGVEILDTDNAYDTSTYKFTPQVAGKYFYYAQIRFRGTVVNNLNNLILRLLKNDTSTTVKAATMYAGSNDEQFMMHVSGIVDMNGSTDNIFYQGYASISSGSPYFEQGGNATSFGAYRIGA